MRPMGMIERVARVLCCFDGECRMRSRVGTCCANEKHEIARAAIEAMREPTETMWGGLARDIVMWMDIYDGGKKTPRNLFRHLEQTGREIPQWLRDEPELKALDHVPSKGTRAVIIYHAMIHAALAEKTP